MDRITYEVFPGLSVLVLRAILCQWKGDSGDLDSGDPTQLLTSLSNIC